MNESHDEDGVTSSQFEVDENSALLLVADVTAPDVLLTAPGDVMRFFVEWPERDVTAVGRLRDSFTRRFFVLK